MSQAIRYFLIEILWFYQQVIGGVTTVALIGLIYNKQLRTSNASNKTFASGEIINFLQNDATNVYNLSVQLPKVANLPFTLITSFIALFYMLGLTFFLSLFIFVLSFAYNFYFSNLRARLTKDYKARQDQRLNKITESLNHIKMIKMFEWTAIFK